ncbi:MAG: hypothetical protein KBE09_00645 [Candidatus Pacebacteria bacterium]|nr:hypothetical protein [Candidatus Paceibacterota bacterium]
MFASLTLLSQKSVALLLLMFVCVTLTLPFFAHAFPFGGQAGRVIPCYNQAILADLGPPIGGKYLWSPATRTYQFGPPRHSGQWLLGLAQTPWYCIITYQPLTVESGTHIMMMGSSQ